MVSSVLKVWSSIVVSVAWCGYCIWEGMEQAMAPSSGMERDLSSPELQLYQPQKVHRDESLVEFFDARQPKCTIGSESESSDMTYLGCGYNGQVFAVSMKCDSDGSDATADTGSNFVIKLMTFAANATDKRKFVAGRIGTYKSDTDLVVQKHKALYQRLLSNTTRPKGHKLLQVIALRLGSVQVPLHMLHQAMKSANLTLTNQSAFAGMVFPVQGYDHYPGGGRGDHAMSPSIRGQVYAHLQDTKNLRRLLADGTNPPSLALRQNIVRDLVFLYRHLFQRGVVVCDMKWDHILYSPVTQTTTLIDLDQFHFTVDDDHPQHKYGLYDKQWQLWQLLIMIARVCDFKAFNRKVKDQISPSIQPFFTKFSCGGSAGPADLLAQAPEIFGAALDRCHMEGSSLVWWKNINDTILRHPSEFYEALAAWSGIQDLAAGA